MPLHQLEHVPVECVCFAHNAARQPLYISRNSDDAIEVKCAEAHTHPMLAFGRPFGFEVDLLLEVRRHQESDLRFGRNQLPQCGGPGSR